MSTQPEAKQVPLVERLESVPVDARLAVDDGPYSTSFYAVGAMAHEAADQLRRLHAVSQELLEALLEERRVRLMGQEDDVHWESLRDMRRAAMAATDAAIAKAEGKV